jgi:hypothetical protein
MLAGWYTYELEYAPNKFMDTPNIVETYLFWKRQKEKGVIVNFFSYPLIVTILGASLEDCDNKLNKLKEELYLHNPMSLSSLSSLTGHELKDLEKKSEREFK